MNNSAGDRLRLPDHAQHTPAEAIPVQPDFYYERNGIPGVCVFLDGQHHAEQTTSRRERQPVFPKRQYPPPQPPKTPPELVFGGLR